MQTQILNRMLQLQLQLTCYLLIRTGKKIWQLKMGKGCSKAKKIKTLQKRFALLDRKINQIDACIEILCNQ